ncbi:MAG: DUF99 family protein [Candidatus Bathyarchaeia archaeon]
MPVVGVEDGSFQKGITKKAILAAVLSKGVEIEDIKVARITVDGLDATDKLTEMLIGWDFVAVLLAGVSFAGFNIIDPTAVYEKFQKPILIVSRKKPNNKAVKQALQKHFKDWKVRWQIFEKLETARCVVVTGETPIYVETIALDFRTTEKLLQALSIKSRIPEPLRVARLVARGLS